MSTLKNRHSIITAVVLVLGVVFTTLCHAACTVQKLATPAPKDPVARVLAAQDACPRTPREFVEALKRLGARMEPTVVNFVGFHNPDAGAFFFFEIVSNAPPSAITIQRGDMLFGHFTMADNDQLVSLQDGGLTVELIAWDPDKQCYNFYELRDGGWVYQGDSKDILDDVELLHRQRSASAPAFGERLRCSGCHVNGGFLQKELTSPHNDWFVQDRQLPLHRLRPDAFVNEKLMDAVDAGELSVLVTASAQRLADSPGYRKVMAPRSMQVRLRPLFCPMEVNIESDAQPFDDRKPTLSLPAAFFVDPRLATAVISIERRDYDAALQRLGSSLPEPPGQPADGPRIDADHGWLTPVKGHSDIVAIDALIEQGVVDKEFVADVLAVDFTNPAFSTKRCDLLKLVPDNSGPGFVGRFQSALRGASEPGAVELLNNLSDPARNAAFHETQARAFLTSCQQRAADPDVVLDWVRLLAQRRVEIDTSEISTNPQGRIIEDGRIVFPTTQPQSGPLALTPACQVQ
jgi:hypothetical protein